MTDTTLIQRLSDEADLCRNDGATDIAKLLDDAVYALVNQAAQIAALRASAEKVILFNRDHANDQYGDPNKAEAWACVRELRAALRQEQPKGEGA